MVLDVKNLVIRNPNWAIENAIQVPFDSVKNDYFFYVADFTVLFRFVFFLEKIFNAKPAGSRAALKRSVDEDQFQIFKSLEGVLQATGMDGKTCLLRTICEFQTNPIGKYSMVGEILTIVLSPRRGLNDFLHEYIEAELIGQSHNQTCASVYKGCPVSVFNLLKQYSSPSDKPVVQDKVATDDEVHGLHTAHHKDHVHDLLHHNELKKEAPLTSHHEHEDSDF